MELGLGVRVRVRVRVRAGVGGRGLGLGANIESKTSGKVSGSIFCRAPPAQGRARRRVGCVTARVSHLLQNTPRSRKGWG